MNYKAIYLYVTPLFPSPKIWHGCYCYDFVRTLQSVSDYDVRVFTPGDGEGYTYGGVFVQTFKRRVLPSNLFPFLWEKKNQQSFLEAVSRTGIQIGQICVCHVNTAMMLSYALAVKDANPGCLTVLHHHDLESFGLGMGILKHCWLYNMYMFPQLRRRHEQIDCHVFISELVKKSFLSAPRHNWSKFKGYRKQMRGLPYRPVRIHHSMVVHNGVDRSCFVRREGFRPNDIFTIGCIGNFIELKGHMTLLKSVRLLRDEGVNVRVKMIGSGPLYETCRKYVVRNKLTDRVQFLQEVYHDQMPSFYRTLDLFVLPSYFEGFGCVFAEAYVSGVPFVTCEGQGISDLLKDDAWLIPPHDAVKLAEKIKWVMASHPQQRLQGELDICKIVADFCKQLGDLQRDIGMNHHD